LAKPLRAQGIRVHASVQWDAPFHDGVVRQVLKVEPALLIVHPDYNTAAQRSLLTSSERKLIASCPCPLLFLKGTRPYSGAAIVAGVDPECSNDKPAELDERILDAACLLGKALSAPLLVLHARQTWDSARKQVPELRDLPTPILDDAHAAYLNEWREKLTNLAIGHGLDPDCVRLVEGKPTEELIHLASTEHADALVVGDTALSWLHRALDGDVAERLFEAADCDLLVVKPTDFVCPVDPETLREQAPSAEMEAYRA